MNGLRKMNATQLSYRRRRLKNSHVGSHQRLTEAYGKLAPAFVQAVSRGRVDQPIEQRGRFNIHLRTEGNETNRTALMNTSQEFRHSTEIVIGKPKTQRLSGGGDISTNRIQERCARCAATDEAADKYQHLRKAYAKLQLENVRLGKQNRQLAEAFRSLCQKGGTPQNISHLKRLQSETVQLEQQLQERRNAEQKQLKILSNMNLKSEFLQRELQSKQDELANTNEKLRRFEVSMSIEMDEQKRFREIALMGQQELQSQRGELLYLRRMMKKMRDDKLRQAEQLKRIESENRATYKLKKSNFDYELQICKTATNSLASVRQGITSLTAKSSKSGTGEPYSRYLDGSVSLSNEEAIYKFLDQDEQYELDLTVFNLGRPSFFSLIAHEYELQGYDSASYFRAHLYSKLNEKRSHVLSIIRSIFDSMHRSFQLEAVTSVRPFPQFVFGWLEEFSVDQQTKKIVQDSKQPAAASKQRFEFYAALMNEAFNDNWEVVSFRQFLLETSSLEELYAYLRMRHFLFRGDLSNQVRAHYDYTIQVELCSIDALLNHFLPCDKINVSYLKNLIKGSATLVKSKKCVDSGFTLRCCLEYYRASRVESFNTLVRKLKKAGGADASLTNTYQQFSMFVTSNYDELSATERASVYRRCFVYGQGGSITAQILFAALTEQRIFLRRLVIEMEERWARAVVLPPSRLLVSACTSITKKISSNCYFKKYVGSLGIAHLTQTLSAPPNSNSPYFLFSQVQCLSRLMLNILKDLVVSPKVSYESIEGIFPKLAQHLQTLYMGTLNRLECIGARDQSVARRLVRLIERVSKAKQQEFNLNVVRKLQESSQAAVIHRRAAKRTPQQPSSQQLD